MSERTINVTDIFSDALSIATPRVRGSYMSVSSMLMQIDDRELQQYASGDADAIGVAIYTMPVPGVPGWDFLAGRISDAFVLIYVDTTDRVKAWRTSHRIVWNADIQEFQLSKTFKLTGISAGAQKAPKPEQKSQDTAGTEIPAEPECDFLRKLSDEELAALGVARDQFDLVRGITGESGLDSYREFLPDGVYERLRDILSGDDTAENIIFEIRQSLVKDNNVARQLEESPLAGRHISSCTDPVIQKFLLSSSRESFDKWTVFLHPSQRKYVSQNYKGSFKLSGGAGTGKTVVALHRLSRMIGENRDDRKRLKYITFTNTLTDNVKGLLRKLDCGTPDKYVNTVTKVLNELARNEFRVIEKQEHFFHSDIERKELLDTAVRSVLDGEGTPEDSWITADFIRDEYDQVIVPRSAETEDAYLSVKREGRGRRKLTRADRKKIWKIVSKYNDLKQSKSLVDYSELFALVTEELNKPGAVKPYTNIIVDEFQDLDELRLRFVRALVPPGENDIFLTGDPYQSIYGGRKIRFANTGINVRGQSRQLKVNYRTTEEIKKVAVTAVETLDCGDGEDGKESLRGYYSVMHGDRPEYWFYKSEDDEFNDIVAAVKQLRENPEYANWSVCITALTNKKVQAIRERLKENGIEVVQENAKGYQMVEQGKIYVKTIHSVKGLEFGAVFVSGINSKINLYYTDDEDTKEIKQEQFKSLVYVALTRAVKYARVSGNAYRRAEPYPGLQAVLIRK